MSERFDYLVIGGGSGGIASARRAAQYGARVAVVEAARLGGTCVNVGCVPKKLFAYAAHVAEEVHDAVGFGWTHTPGSFDWPTLVANKNKEIERLNGIYGRMLDDSGVTLLRGHARFVAPDAVSVGNATYRAQLQVPRSSALTLDLGQVHDVARVRLNGSEVATLWNQTGVDVTNFVHAGRNELEIIVSVGWPNRLIGDAALPPAQRKTWTTFNPYTATSPLREAGLLGPVRLIAR